MKRPESPAAVKGPGVLFGHPALFRHGLAVAAIWESIVGSFTPRSRVPASICPMGNAASALKMMVYE